MRMLLGYIRPYATRMAGGVTVKFLGSVMDLLLPWILAYMIDTVVPMKDAGAIVFWGAMMLVCSVIAVLGNIIANRMASRVSRDITRNLRHDLFSKALNLSSAQADVVGVPHLITCLSSDTYNVHRMVSSMQRLGIRAPILLLGGIAVTLALEPVLSMTLIAVLPFIALVVWLVSRRGIPMFGLLQKAVDAMVRVVREDASGVRVIKALSKTEGEKARFGKANDAVTERERAANTTMAASSPLMNLLLNLGLTLVVVVGAFRVDGRLTQPGKILAFLSYFAIISGAMMAVTRMFVILSQGSASAGRIAEVMLLPADLAPTLPDHVDTDAHILFENVSFSYPGGSAEGRDLDEVSFALRRGQTLGIIGATGSGKSTLIQLLMRLYDADAGRIRIGGDDIRGIAPAQLHAMFGVVFQGDTLFADSVLENVDFGRELPVAAVRRAVRLAQAEEFIDDIEAGYDHRLAQRGANLSGGQRQRLLIARALAAKPDILILDDSSSALDYRTDQKLRAAIRKDLAGTTAVIVAQRVSSIMHADLILLLDEGRIAGRGSHAELMEQSEIYREIALSQMGEAPDGY